MQNFSKNRTVLNRVLFSLASLSFVVSGASGAQAQTDISAMPADHSGWVQAPGQLMRPDCVHEIPNGAKVETRDGQITGDVTLKGALLAHYEPCSEAAVITRPRGRTLANTPGTGNGWVEAAQMDLSLSSSDNIDFMAGFWKVPSNPSANGALIYLFNGIEPATENWILQPVLQYGVGAAGGGNYWAIASWLVGPNYVFHSGLVTVQPGNSLFGYTEQTGTSGSTLDYRVEAYDETTGAYSWITAGTSGLHWTWGFSGVLEAYNVTSCAQFPSNDYAQFTSSTIDHGYPNYTSVSPTGLYGAIYSYGGPSCGFYVSPGSTSTLYF